MLQWDCWHGTSAMEVVEVTVLLVLTTLETLRSKYLGAAVRLIPDTYFKCQSTPTANIKLLELTVIVEGVFSWKLSTCGVISVRFTMTMKRVTRT